MDASSSAAEQRVVREPAWVRRGLIGIAIAFLGLFLFVPLAAVFTEALQREYLGIVRGEIADRHGWMTLVRS